MRISRIKDTNEIAAMLDWALVGRHPLAIRGAGSKSGIGRPIMSEAVLDLGGYSGITLYEPGELVMRALAGTSLALIRTELARNAQRLAFDPPDYGPLFGFSPDSGSIGGAFSSNLSGSARIKAGSARDHLLGVSGYTGRGTPFQTGSRVMKNVTGYDLCKLVAGSYGTLVVASDFTFKVLPAPEVVRTLILIGVALHDAPRLMNSGLSSRHDVAAAAYVPADIAAALTGKTEGIDRAFVALKVEGVAASADFRLRALQDELKGSGDITVLETDASNSLWASLGAAAPFAGPEQPLWRLSIPPANAATVAAALLAEIPGARYFLDWGGGLVWIEVPESVSDGGEGVVRRSVGAGGHATLIRGSDALRLSISPFQPQSAAIQKINARIKDAFDPHHILNPGRMTAGEEGEARG